MYSFLISKMKSIFLNFKNVLPYLLIIIIYFFFINIEARKDQNNLKKELIKKSDETEQDSKNIIKQVDSIRIQVIPYSR